MTVPVNEGQATDAAVSAAASLQREGVFDHAVLNLHYDLDAGEQLFRALGFNVTPRSYHTLGSMNNLIVFGTNYLELIGLARNCWTGRSVSTASSMEATILM